MNEEQSAGGIIINNKTGKIVVVNQKGSSWSLPKGHIENSEDPLTAAYREIKEETGLEKITLVKAFEPYSRLKYASQRTTDPSNTKKMHIFLFTTDEEELKPIDPDNPEARWVTKEEAVHFISNPGDREFLKKTIAAL